MIKVLTFSQKKYASANDMYVCDVIDWGRSSGTIFENLTADVATDMFSASSKVHCKGQFSIYMFLYDSLYIKILFYVSISINCVHLNIFVWYIKREKWDIFTIRGYISKLERSIYPLACIFWSVKFQIAFFRKATIEIVIFSRTIEANLDNGESKKRELFVNCKSVNPSIIWVNTLNRHIHGGMYPKQSQS